MDPASAAAEPNQFQDYHHVRLALSVRSEPSGSHLCISSIRLLLAKPSAILQGQIMSCWQSNTAVTMSKLKLVSLSCTGINE